MLVVDVNEAAIVEKSFCMTSSGCLPSLWVLIKWSCLCTVLVMI